MTLHFSGASLESAYSELLPGREIILLVAGLCLALGNGIVGFTDDFIKIKLKRNEGLSAKQKSLGQLIVALGYVATLWFSHNTVWYLPFAGSVNFERNFGTGLLFWVLSIFIIYGTVNSVNLTDGIDGLCSSVTATVAIAFIYFGMYCGYTGMSILAAAILGGVLGFLCWNWPGQDLYGRHRQPVPGWYGCRFRLLYQVPDFAAAFRYRLCVRDHERYYPDRLL